MPTCQWPSPPPTPQFRPHGGGRGQGGPAAARHRLQPAEPGRRSGAAGSRPALGGGAGLARGGAERGGSGAQQPATAPRQGRGGAGAPRRRWGRPVARRCGEGQWPQAALGLAAARAGTRRSGPAACAGDGARRRLAAAAFRPQRSQAAAGVGGARFGEVERLRSARRWLASARREGRRRARAAPSASAAARRPNGGGAERIRVGKESRSTSRLLGSSPRARFARRTAGGGSSA